MAEGLSKDEIISSFCGITGVSSSEAADFLNAADWNADAALAEFYQSQEDDAAPAAAPSAAAAATPPVEPSYTGPRTLDGRPAPHSQPSSSRAAAASSSSSSARQPAQKKKGLMTMDAIRGGNGGGGSGGGGGGHGHGHGHGHDDDDEDDDDDSDDDHNRGRGDLFAGGEKSGLAVQDPNAGGPSSDAQKVIRDIIAKAKANRGEPSERPADPSQPSASSSRFRGSGQTLGGEGTESRMIPDPSARPAAAAGGAAASGSAATGAGGSGSNNPDEAQERVLHIWQDGFSIDDGALHRYDDPNNAADLQMIRQGRAPLHLMNVQFGQAVDVKLHEHEENWHQLPRVYRPFSGEGRRLGSPVPGGAATTAAVPISTATSAAVSSSAAASAASAAANSTPTPAVDDSLPMLTIRVQLPDGTRLPARFNTTQTIGDVYEFVQRALPTAQQTRAWVLATTFPSQEHTDKALVLGETAEFKRGGAAVVKWV